MEIAIILAVLVLAILLGSPGAKKEEQRKREYWDKNLPKWQEEIDRDTEAYRMSHGYYKEMRKQTWWKTKF